MSDRRAYLVIYEHGATSWGAYVPDLPGCIAVADTLDEVKRLIREAMEAHLDIMHDTGESIPEPTTQAERVPVPA